jgi:hypothetical protein
VARSFLSGTGLKAGAVHPGKFSVCGRGPCSRGFFLPEGLSRSGRTSAPSGARKRFGWSAGYVVGLRSRRAPLGGYAAPFGECERPSRFGPLSRGTSSRGGRSVVLRRGQGPGERALRSEDLTIGPEEVGLRAVLGRKGRGAGFEPTLRREIFRVAFGSPGEFRARGGVQPRSWVDIFGLWVGGFCSVPR